jgi:2,3-bisphosphoglycerate-dependent phosphoglycerate mutase
MYWPGRDRKYFDLSPDQIPATESLQDCMERAAPVWDDKIRKELRKGKNVMVVAHANTLRGLVKTIDNIGDDEIQEVAIPTGIPIIYKFDKQMNVLPPSGDRQTASQIHMRGLFLEKPGLLKEALKREEEWSTQVPGYDSTMGRTKQPMTPLERSLFKLKAERELGTWAGKFIDPNAPIEDDGNDGNAGRPMQFVEDQVWEAAMKETHTSSLSFENEDSNYSNAISNADDENDDYSENPVSPSLITTNPCVMSTLIGDIPIRTDSVLVIIRHGKTEHNKLGLFTGWEDAPLAKDGVDEAREAGKLLKLHGFEFDVVYTSWLSRAIQTAWLCMDEMDCLWLPIIKSWRLNERMYGSLTGLSKRMVAQRHGEKQFMAWRRGFKTRPPPVSSFSQHYPGNDARYQNLNDVRYSFRESLIRSIEAGKIVVRRKLPKHESLKDCMDRTIPYFTERIIPEALAQGKRVLISSSENAIRGLLMYLCEIPEDQITGLEIPNGLPLIYDLTSKCVKLLDDGTGRDPLEVYNFGKAARYLFRPCQNEDGSPDDDCDITFMSNFLTGDNEVSAEQVKVLEDIKRRVAA